MRTLKFSKEELNEMKLFYSRELEQTLKRLDHIKSVLDKLSDNGHSQRVEVSVEKAAEPEEAPVAKAAKPARKKKGKRRGPKAIWGDFILKRLDDLDRPLTYSELINEAMKHFNIRPENQEKARQAITNSAFRLRQHHKEIDTFSVKGQREKYIALSQWFDDKGRIRREYADKAKPI